MQAETDQDNTQRQPADSLTKKGKKMKKIVLTLVAVLSMTAASAENENLNATNAYVLNVNMNSLSRALQLTADQREFVKDVNDTFCAEMLNAATADNSERKELTRTAVIRDLKYMRAILDNDQYRKYITILNATFNNRGIVCE